MYFINILKKSFQSRLFKFFYIKQRKIREIVTLEKLEQANVEYLL